MHANPPLPPSDLEPVLRALANPLRAEADALLDLREGVTQPEAAGKCIACYFKLLAAAKRRPGAVNLEPLRTWLDRYVRVQVRDARGAVLESLPVAWSAEDLEACCVEAMQEIRENRVYPQEVLELRFAFTPEQAA